ncbi:glycosyltransferase [Vibrio mediterranei]|uniref:glycosyltransferase n=1 Tax=Vibrio mediterranei TaxID=689 RepID=UPI0017BB788D|nr:glycosyltransferase [Vibrio mediterranei]NUW73006.1 glycosyltransferase [Vibrio mediterranei]
MASSPLIPKHNSGSTYKVVHVVQHLAPGGLETMVLELLKQAKEDERVFIISLEGELEQAIKHWPQLIKYRSHLFFLGKKPGSQITLLRVMYRLLKVLKPQVVHTHHIGPLIYGGIAARLNRVPARIHTEHDMWHLTDAKRQKVENLALKVVNPILVADAQKVQQQLSQLFPYTTPTVIKNGVDCNRFVPANQAGARRILGLPAKVTLIGTAGRLEPVKAQATLIKSIARLSNDIHLAIAGIGSLEQELKDLAKALKVEDRVHFLGLVNDMPSFYQSLDLFCLPSVCEGFPLSPLEAQACNVPVVVTDVGAAKETLCPLSGVTTKSNRVFSLVQALENALKTRHLFCPRDFVVENNDVRSMSEAYRNLVFKA